MKGRTGQIPPETMKRRREFLAARRGMKGRGPYFLLELLDRKDDLPPRAGFTVTRRSGNAVIRNRIRRRLKEALRVHAADAMAPGHDYVFVGRPDSLAVDFETLAREMKRRISRTGRHGKST
ncbi:ribonuclease P protein component [Notoacmeibacter sp. MSK16QG-6]|uniref:ribonuclease P protein component n=1 Tax=Notoacmeibacter sp. MSK16QG-6 TaxID=2957982 RepID=UPI00209E343A|nr:ribonuclease P protein component [Notoacmeibacter sp. MSK16QG-6]MCP1198713.1 ribonuclease P protein component [Notoacmeibacter sp. MSK16QG-6]